ncbi:hypothetical protein F3Y22_tig00110864pilonHSYRG00201 [Hibiscus syriacus]|uniref:TCP domain-containing protein n=1 Tax=Hibiscus syriacus TaxID=106335 RepID=A0A6A2ZIY2_HIBSY|nr:hypothetical protein F3Y22_tig00110864pilonHSYRG00201 [Hibiscus syriacus]
MMMRGWFQVQEKRVVFKQSKKAKSTVMAARSPRFHRVRGGGLDFRIRGLSECRIFSAGRIKDCRIRLSVPTAIQLYDWQDRLDLNQPSKVVNWLLEATKDDIFASVQERVRNDPQLLPEMAPSSFGVPKEMKMKMKQGR